MSTQTKELTDKEQKGAFKEAMLRLTRLNELEKCRDALKSAYLDKQMEAEYSEDIKGVREVILKDFDATSMCIIDFGYEGMKLINDIEYAAVFGAACFEIAIESHS